MNFITTCLFAFVIILQGCSTQLESIHIGRYESSPWGFNTNTWWVEGPEGVVLINTQFLPSATKEAIEIAESYTGKKVVLAFVLHANPDKFNGTGYLLSKGIRVVTSEQVRSRIPEVDKLRRTWFYDRYKPDYPEKLILPESLGSKNTTLKAAGLTFKVHTFGASVSKDHIVVEVGGHFFVGDILANKHHSWLELGLIDKWLSTLKRLESLRPTYLYPGRGYASSKELLNHQRNYLKTFQDIINKSKMKSEFNDERKNEVVEKMKNLYPDYGNSYFLNLGVEPVWRGATSNSANN